MDRKAIRKNKRAVTIQNKGERPRPLPLFLPMTAARPLVRPLGGFLGVGSVGVLPRVLKRS